MKEIKRTDSSEIIGIHKINEQKPDPDSDYDFKLKSKIPEILAEEGYNSFITYLEWLGLEKDPDFIILSPRRYYFYDAEELKKIRTVINLQELNRIKDVRKFFRSIADLIEPKTYFAGYFTDNKKNSKYALNGKSSKVTSEKSFALENGIMSKVPLLNFIYNKLDLRTNSYMNGHIVRLMLSEAGFKVLDLTEMNDYTYFCAQKPTNP